MLYHKYITSYIPNDSLSQILILEQPNNVFFLEYIKPVSDRCKTDKFKVLSSFNFVFLDGKWSDKIFLQHAVLLSYRRF
jgi:hypothetical protein